MDFNRKNYIDKHIQEGVHLLDQSPDTDLVGRTSQNLMEKMINNATDNWYSKSSISTAINLN